MGLKEDALHLHQVHKGKISVIGKVSVEDNASLSLAYTPGVAEPCKEIAADPNLVYEYTAKGNLVAVVTDGSAVLGLGDIGPAAGLPVMEGKAVLFKAFANVDAFPICLATQDVDEIVRTVALLEPTFGGINLEDISAPRCFEIERRLKEIMDIPVFHDDQHGTAVVVTAALTNALKVVGKKKEDIIVAISGAGAAAQAVTRLLLRYGVKEIRLCDIEGVIYQGKPGLDSYREEIASLTNPGRIRGSLADIMRGADVFIGLSAPNLVSGDMIRSMADKPIVFALANPTPEIFPDQALAAGAAIAATGRSDYPNQINNVLAFPGIFRGALDVRARAITEEMKLAASQALSGMIADDQLSPTNILPYAFEPNIAAAVAAAVAQSAIDCGAARLSHLK